MLGSASLERVLGSVSVRQASGSALEWASELGLAPASVLGSARESVSVWGWVLGSVSGWASALAWEQALGSVSAQASASE